VARSRVYYVTRNSPVAMGIVMSHTYSS